MHFNSAATILCCLFFSVGSQVPDGIELIMVAGSTLGNQHSQIGIDAKNNNSQTNINTKFYPGSRTDAIVWKDIRENVWLFGGEGYSHFPTEETKVLNDLWYMNGETLQWTPRYNISQDLNAKESGRVHRLQPMSRKGGAGCGIEDLIFVIFAGAGSNAMIHQDTWIYEIGKQEWLPLYQKHGQASSEEVVRPAARAYMASWCLSDRMIILGGVGEGGEILDDLWEFSMRTLTWKKHRQKVQLRTLPEDQAIDGQLFPSERHSAATWSSRQHDMLYIFGGSSAAREPEGDPIDILHTSLLNDLWAFNMTSKSWKLLHNTAMNAGPCPSPRLSAISWMDHSHNKLWLWGGIGVESPNTSSVKVLSDIWHFIFKTDKWVHIDNDKVKTKFPTMDPTPSWMQNISAHPQCCAAVWASHNVLFKFGGLGTWGGTQLFYLNDLSILVTSKMFPIPGIISDIISSSPGAFIHWFKRQSPMMVFLMCLTTIGGIGMMFGAILCLKKMIDYPRHHPPKNFNVKYSALLDEANLLDAPEYSSVK